ncbi:unnamed protein product [Euphydryas editha]|uniref:Uncharacterized protein n=1 Tax=Euphydryas editha TaxID=104508 RepID=A0AAU9UMR9_EUPED|nr:unnamed protein product [Euphydryas editha]
MANRRCTGFDNQISLYLAALDGNKSEDGAEEDEKAKVDHPLEDESLGANVDPSEEDPPIIEDPEIEQEPAVRNGQTRRQMMRRLLREKQASVSKPIPHSDKYPVPLAPDTTDEGYEILSNDGENN